MNGIVWRQHPTSGKWHAFAEDQASACKLTSKAVGEARPDVPPWPFACWKCCAELGIKASVTRVPEPETVVEEMRAEFVGGPFDGERLTLKVVRHSHREHTVLNTRYERPWIERAGRDLTAQATKEQT